MEAEKSPFGGMKLFFIAYFALLMLALTFIGVMGSLSYEMVNPSAKFVLFGLLTGSAMIAGAIWIVRRIWRKWVKIAVGALLTVVILAVTVGMSLTFSLVLVAATPLHYTTLTSPGGEAVVVMREISNDADRLAERMQAAGLDATQGPRTEADLGELYTAHPRKLRFFYNKKISGEGSIEIGRASEAQLMYEWTDDAMLHLYIDAPEPGDGGEIFFPLAR